MAGLSRRIRPRIRPPRERCYGTARRTRMLLAIEKAKGLTFAELGDRLGAMVAALCYRQAASPEEATKLVAALGLAWRYPSPSIPPRAWDQSFQRTASTAFEIMRCTACRSKR